jgi:hypothetical protein
MREWKAVDAAETNEEDTCKKRIRDEKRVVRRQDENVCLPGHDRYDSATAGSRYHAFECGSLPLATRHHQEEIDR